MSHRPRLAKWGRVDRARLRGSGRWSPLGNGSVGIVHRRRHDAVRAYPSDPADAAPTMGALSGCPPCEAFDDGGPETEDAAVAGNLPVPVSIRRDHHRSTYHQYPSRPATAPAAEAAGSIVSLESVAVDNPETTAWLLRAVRRTRVAGLGHEDQGAGGRPLQFTSATQPRDVIARPSRCPIPQRVPKWAAESVPRSVVDVMSPSLSRLSRCRQSDYVPNPKADYESVPALGEDRPVRLEPRGGAGQCRARGALRA